MRGYRDIGVGVLQGAMLRHFSGLKSVLCAVTFMTLLSAVAALAHGGGKDAEGCHVDSRTNERHCHVTPTTPPDDERPTCQDFPRCTGCGCAGGPGYRDRETEDCVGHDEVDRICGNPRTLRCDFENAPNTDVNKFCLKRTDEEASELLARTAD